MLEYKIKEFKRQIDFGIPFAVGGPSKKTHCLACARMRSDSAKTSRWRQRSSTSSSSDGRS